MDKEELKHSIDHVLSDLDVEPWDEYKEDCDFVKVKIDDAVKQLLLIRDELIDRVY